MKSIISAVTKHFVIAQLYFTTKCDSKKEYKKTVASFQQIFGILELCGFTVA